MSVLRISGKSRSAGSPPPISPPSSLRRLLRRLLRRGFLLRRLLRLGYEGQEGFGGQDGGQDDRQAGPATGSFKGLHAASKILAALAIEDLLVEEDAGVPSSR